MTSERYSQWMSVWKWFSKTPGSTELATLYNMLNEMWQQDRKATPAERLAEYSQPRIEDEPEFKKFLQDLDEGFSKPD